MELKELAEKLPKLCYVFVAGNCPGYRIGIIKLGEVGYYPTEFDSQVAADEIAKQAVNEFNKKLGVTPAQAEAMKVGSMFGWDVPGADPAKYEEKLDATQ
jgi:hypothetical protein